MNADDFGLARGVNQGILEAHTGGILTSTTLLVDGPAAEDAAQRARSHPQLGIGLHFEADPDTLRNADTIRERLEQQLHRFSELLGRPPTHVDSHRHVHLLALPLFAEIASDFGLRTRGDGSAHLIRTFYAHAGDRSQVHADRLQNILSNDVQPGGNELMCHPGRVSNDLTSSYRHEREDELEALTDRRVRLLLERLRITPISYTQLVGLC